VVTIAVNPIYLFSFLALVVLMFLYGLKRKAYQRQMIYKMYAVRDELVFLVAQDKIQENSKVFQYYYKRVNLLLRQAPNIGLDDMVNQLLLSKKSSKSNIEQTKQEVDELLKLKELECEDVRTVIQDYYEVSRDMILAHSSYVNLLFVIFLKGGLLKHYLKRMVPSNIKVTLQAVDFASREANNIKQLA
jgi:TATA-binding protein-associated factor Taf7